MSASHPTPIVFRVDASDQIGLGHMMRCIALAEALLAYKQKIVFAVNQKTKTQFGKRLKAFGDTQIVPATISHHQEAAWLKVLCDSLASRALVLDGYQFERGYRRELSASNVPLILFDDMNNSGELYADMVINGAGSADTLGYTKTAANAVLCLKDNYRVLRSEFSKHPEVSWPQRQGLCIVMGGSDPANLTLPLLTSLLESGFSAPVTVVTGAAYPHVQAMNEFLSCHATFLGTRLTHLHNCENMAQVFSHARLVISAAGSSQFELAACNTPAILLVIADNQIKATVHAEQQGWCQALDMRAEGAVEVVTRRALELWSNEKQLKHMHQTSKEHADAKGADRVAKKIMTLIGAKQ